jgi:hypothetical protein
MMNNVEVCDRALAEVMAAEAAVRMPVPTNWEQERAAQRLHLDDSISIHLNTYDNVIIPALFPETHDVIANPKHRSINDDGSYHYVAMDDLPDTGRTDAPYKVLSTGDLFKFIDGQYMAFNPYAPQGQQVSAPRAEIIDDTANMPTGGKGPLSVIYNVHALRRDLHAKASLNWSFMDMVPQGIIARADDVKTQRSKYFRHSHKALLNQIRTEVRKNGALVREYVDALKRIEVDVWYDNEKHEFGFKDGEFVVVFA